ncbi:cytochrome P450 4C1 [Anabrus simplex]|uniref:cytochrome P450 4C1 n=1 Tax=Anabrus simplex TaxID=316456 RepID=UPI0035A36A42
MVGLGYVGWIALVVIICFVCFKIWWSRRRLRELASLIQGPETVPVLGNVHQFFGGPRKAANYLRELLAEYQGRAFRIWFGPLLYVCITAPEDVELLLANQRLLNRDRYLMRILSRFLGNGLTTCASDTWRKQRKMVNPAFHTKVVESYMEVFNKQAKVLSQKLKSFADGNVFDAYRLVGLCTFDMICESTLGVTLNAQDYRDAQFILRTVHKMMHLLFKRAVRPWLIFDGLYNLTEMGKEQKKGETLLRALGDIVIFIKMEAYRAMKSSKAMYEEWEKKKSTFMDHMISTAESEGTTLTEKQLRDEVNTIMMAGQETTASNLCFIFMLLGMFPKHQDEIYQELKEVFDDDWDRPVTPQDLKQFKYLDRFIKEAMRVVPVVTLIPREVEEEVKLSTCTLPAGCVAVVGTYVVHRDPRFFPDPERFDPERFLPERSKGRHPYSYIPFGAGPRMCVGFKYAEMQMATTVATVLKSYRVLPTTSYESLLQELELGLVVRPAKGFQVKMVPR